MSVSRVPGEKKSTMDFENDRTNVYTSSVVWIRDDEKTKLKKKEQFFWRFAQKERPETYACPRRHCSLILISREKLSRSNSKKTVARIRIRRTRTRLSGHPFISGRRTWKSARVVITIYSHGKRCTTTRARIQGGVLRVQPPPRLETFFCVLASYGSCPAKSVRFHLGKKSSCRRYARLRQTSPFPGYV